jgi:hypothetical protein
MHIGIIVEKNSSLLNKASLAISSVIILYLLTSSITQSVNAQLSISVGPKPPTNLTANVVTPSKISLSWTAPSDPASSVLTGYKIERSTDGGNTWSVIVANTGNTATRFTDTGLAHGTTYTYRVSSINPIGTSSPSNTASATTPSGSVFAGFATCCYGFINIHGGVSNPISGVNHVQLLVYAPNGTLVLNKTEPTFFQDGYGISRSDGKGNYVIAVTYVNELVAKTEVPSLINNDPVIIFDRVTENTDSSVYVIGRVANDIPGEQVSVTILDPNNSQTATYALNTNLHAQFDLFIDSASAVNAFPTSGNYTIVVTHLPTGVTAKAMLTYTR